MRLPIFDLTVCVCRVVWCVVLRIMKTAEVNSTASAVGSSAAAAAAGGGGGGAAPTMIDTLQKLKSSPIDERTGRAIFEWYGVTHVADAAYDSTHASAGGVWEHSNLRAFLLDLQSAFDAPRIVTGMCAFYGRRDDRVDHSLFGSLTITALCIMNR